MTEYWIARVRTVDVKICAVTTIAGGSDTEKTSGIGIECSISDPIALVFDRSANNKPETVLFVAGYGVLQRLDLLEGELSVCAMPAVNGIQIDSYVIATSGHLIVTFRKTNSIYLFDPDFSGGDTSSCNTGTDTAAAGSNCSLVPVVAVTATNRSQMGRAVRHDFKLRVL